MGNDASKQKKTGGHRLGGAADGTAAEQGSVTTTATTVVMNPQPKPSNPSHSKNQVPSNIRPLLGAADPSLPAPVSAQDHHQSGGNGKSRGNGSGGGNGGGGGNTRHSRLLDQVPRASKSVQKDKFRKEWKKKSAEDSQRAIQGQRERELQERIRSQQAAADRLDRPGAPDRSRLYANLQQQKGRSSSGNRYSSSSSASAVSSREASERRKMAQSVNKKLLQQQP